jgi:tetratricopeptide (TPR) repeat protein/TolB-like protein
LSDHIPTLAIVPFTDRSASENQLYLCEGLSDEIVNRLTQTSALRVIVAGSTSKAAAVATAVLTGEVDREGNEVSVSAQLASPDGVSGWSNIFRFDLSNTPVIAEEIARAATQSLGVPHPDGVEPRCAASSLAYDYYLRGRHYSKRRTSEGLQKGIDWFRAAIGEDPRYALAESGLAHALVMQATYGLVPPGPAMRDAHRAAETAIQLDSRLAEGYTSLGFVLAALRWSWADAALAFRRALELRPGHAPAWQAYATHCLSPAGQIEDAERVARRAAELDPLSPTIRMTVGVMLLFARRFDEAIDWFRAMLQQDPNIAGVYYFLSRCLAQNGRTSDAIRTLNEWHGRFGNEARVYAALGYCHALNGDTDTALAILELLARHSKRHYVSPADFALVNTGLKQSERAFEWLQSAVEERSTTLIWLAVDPEWDSLRSDSRFAELLRALGLKAYDNVSASGR